MGGNALKKVVASRIDLVTYLAIQSEISTRFNDKLAIMYPIELPNKVDFGDVDVLFCFEGCVGDIGEVDVDQKRRACDLIVEEYNPCDMVCNGQVYSFSYMRSFVDGSNSESAEAPIYYQVDFIHCPNLALLPMYHFFFSHGDTGSILGRIMKSHGLGLGFQGLWVDASGGFLQSCLDMKHAQDEKQAQTIKLVPDKVYSKIMLSSCPREICSFIGLVYEDFYTTNAFTSASEIYKWICSCKFMVLENFNSAMNYEHKQRCIKRKFYGDFLEHVNAELMRCKPLQSGSTHGVNAVVGHSGVQFLVQELGAVELRDPLPIEACRHFSKLQEIDAIIEKEQQLQARRLKYNGELVQQWYAEYYGEVYLSSSGSGGGVGGCTDTPTDNDETSTSIFQFGATLVGKPLGIVMKRFKHHVVRVCVQALAGAGPVSCDSPCLHTGTDVDVDGMFNAWLDELSDMEIKTAVLSFFKDYM